MRVLRVAWIGLLVLNFWACGRPHSAIEPSFYHWKTQFSPASSEKEKLAALGVSRLYIKYFDVDWPEDATKAMPQANVQFVELPTVKIVPTVFITNRAIQKTGETDCRNLADNIFRLIFELHPSKLPPPEEVQIDCDWTASTRAAYFALLERLGQRLDSMGIALSATIRLHQVKYPKQTGVPPVNRGMLMFYNMGDLDNPSETNSILEVNEGLKYIENLDQYQLSLDVALPIFAWGVLIRQGKPIKLLNNLRLGAVQDVPWLTKTAENQMRVDTNHYFWGHYLYKGDAIRLEEVTVNALLESAQMLRSKLAMEDRSISFYHLDSSTLSYYRTEALDSVFQIFKD